MRSLLILTAALRAFPSIFQRATLRLLAKTLALTLLLFALLGAALWSGFHAARLALGWGGGGLAEASATAIALVAAGWLLFRATAMAVMKTSRTIRSRTVTTSRSEAC